MHSHLWCVWNKAADENLHFLGLWMSLQVRRSFPSDFQSCVSRSTRRITFLVVRLPDNSPVQLPHVQPPPNVGRDTNWYTLKMKYSIGCWLIHSFSPATNVGISAFPPTIKHLHAILLVSLFMG